MGAVAPPQQGTERLVAALFRAWRGCGTPSRMASKFSRSISDAAPRASLAELNRELEQCRRCPRLAAFREQIGIEKRRAYREWEYWARPVPGFGDPQARVLILGLAPGAHGSNRTGRMFTGDSSGRFLFDVLYESGFASQPIAIDRNDGLRLTDCYITAALRCVPPANKPLPEELMRCAPFLDREFALLRRLRVVVALGRIGFEACLRHLHRQGALASKSEFGFGHGAEYRLVDGRTLLASYHPSNQNTQTGKLTRAMLMDVFMRARQLATED